MPEPVKVPTNAPAAAPAAATTPAPAAKPAAQQTPEQRFTAIAAEMHSTQARPATEIAQLYLRTGKLTAPDARLRAVCALFPEKQVNGKPENMTEAIKRAYLNADKLSLSPEMCKGLNAEQADIAKYAHQFFRATKDDRAFDGLWKALVRRGSNYVNPPAEQAVPRETAIQAITQYSKDLAAFAKQNPDPADQMNKFVLQFAPSGKRNEANTIAPLLDAAEKAAGVTIHPVVKRSALLRAEGLDQFAALGPAALTYSSLSSPAQESARRQFLSAFTPQQQEAIELLAKPQIAPLALVQGLRAIEQKAATPGAGPTPQK